MARKRNPWIGIGLDAWALSFEAASVVGLRSLKIASGGAAAEAEARRMVAEKVDAAVSLGALMMTGRLGATPTSAASRTLTHYRRKVRANRRRLAGG